MGNLVQGENSSRKSDVDHPKRDVKCNGESSDDNCLLCFPWRVHPRRTTLKWLVKDEADRNESEREESKSNVSDSNPNRKNVEASVGGCLSEEHVGLYREEVILSTAKLIVHNGGTEKYIRAVFDSGACISMITEKLARQLQVRRYKSESVVQAIEDVSVSVNPDFSFIQFSPYFNPDISFKIKVYIIENICTYLPPFKAGELVRKYLNHVTPADPELGKIKPMNISLLMGANTTPTLLMPGMIRISDNIIAQETKCGWILIGSYRVKRG